MKDRYSTPKELDPSLPDISPYIDPKPGETYKCNICCDYGGVIDNNAPMEQGLPQGRVCECQLVSEFE